MFGKNMLGKKKDNKKQDKMYSDFLKAGGGISGVYDVSDKKTAAFVKKYRKFIPDNEVYTRDKRGYLVPVYKQKRRK